MSKLIDIIIYTDNELYFDENIKYIKRLTLNSAFSFRILALTLENDLFFISGNNLDVKADYRLFVRDNTFITYPDIVIEMIDSFATYADVGIIGVLGSDNGDAWNLGSAVVSDGYSTELYDYNCEKKDRHSAVMFSDCCFMDCNEYEWNYQNSYEDNARSANYYYCSIGKHAYILDSRYAYCHIDLEKNNSNIVLKNAIEIGKLELKNSCYKFCLGLDEKSLVEKYEAYKFLLRRVENRFDKADICELYEAYYDGVFTNVAVSQLVKTEIALSNRVLHSLTTSSPEKLACVRSDNYECINVITSINRNYIAPLCVMLKSLFDNNSDSRFDVYILNSELTDEDEKLLLEYVEKHDSNMFFIEVDTEQYEKIPINTWSVETLYRLEMLDRLPDSVERILYLDVDIIVQQDLKDFYFTDFEGYDLVACKDMGAGDKAKEGLFSVCKPNIEYTYCCAGVILWNVKKLKQDKIGLETYLEVAEKNKYHLFAPDQDLINYVHAGKIKLFDELRYDCFMYGVLWSEYEVRRDVAIAHYAGPKPWNDIYLEVQEGKWDLSKIEPSIYDIWWDYIYDTPFEKYFLERKKSFLTQVQ